MVIETVMSIVKASPLWLQTIFEVIVVMFVAMLLVSIIAGFWFAGCLLRKRVNYIAEIQLMPPKLTFYQKAKPSEDSILPPQ